MASNTSTHENGSELTALIGARIGGAEVPERVVVAPWGKVESTAGEFHVDEESARLAVTAFEEHATDLPIDYEHQTLGGSFSSPDGKAPAAGWITHLSATPEEGLVASVTWTEEGRSMLIAKAYRYLSPVAVIRKSDRKLVGIHSVALTNKPAIVGMAAIVNRDDPSKQVSSHDLIAALCQTLDLDESNAVDNVDILLLAARERIETLEAQSHQQEAEAAVAAVAATGKLTEGQRPWALQLALTQRDLFDQWARTAPIVVPLGRTLPPQSSGGPTSEQAVSRRASAEYKSSGMLQSLVGEDAYVADAMRIHRSLH